MSQGIMPPEPAVLCVAAVAHLPCAAATDDGSDASPDVRPESETEGYTAVVQRSDAGERPLGRRRLTSPEDPRRRPELDREVEAEPTNHDLMRFLHAAQVELSAPSLKEPARWLSIVEEHVAVRFDHIGANVESTEPFEGADVAARSCTSLLENSAKQQMEGLVGKSRRLRLT